MRDRDEALGGQIINRECWAYERGGGGRRSINWDFIIANNHPKLLCVDIYAEANCFPSSLPFSRPYYTRRKLRMYKQTHTRASERKPRPSAREGVRGGGGGVEGRRREAARFWWSHFGYYLRVACIRFSPLRGLRMFIGQKLTGNLFRRIVDGNYYFIDGHARTTDLLLPPLIIIYWPVFRFAKRTERYYRKRAPTALCSFVH